MKIRIANEEVLASNDFTINQEMLNTPSVILNNVYPKSWEQDKDYVSRFYHPNDYSQCQIVEDYEALPGENVEGTSFQINVDNTLQSNITHLKGQTTQNGTPTPSTPIPIETVTGDQEIVAIGKNLLGLSFSNSYAGRGFNFEDSVMTYYGNGNLSYTSNKYNLNIPNGSNVAMSLEYDSGTLNSGLITFRISFYDSSDTLITTLSANDIGTSAYKTKITRTGTLNQSASYIKVYVQSYQTKLTGDLKFKCQLEIGSSSSSYEPYISKTTFIKLGDIELCKIGDYQGKIAKSTGKNLYSGTDPLTERYTYMIPSKIGETYTLSFTGSTTATGGGSRVILQNSENIERTNIIEFKVAYLTSTTANYNITLSSTINGYLFLSLAYPLSSFTINNIMLEKGSTASEYEPYLAKGKWYLEKHFKKYYLKDFTFSLSGRRQLSAETPDGILMPSSNSATIQMLCSHYVKRTANGTYNRNQGISLSQANKIYIYDDNYNDQTSLGDYNTWVANNNPYFIAQLETPTYTEITDTTLINELESLELLYGINNVSVNGELPGILGIHYNWRDYYEDLIFCGVVKNSGNISLNPRYPHYSTLQILDYKTFLSEGETLDFVIANKTILEAINEVISSISDYGFELGNVDILGSNEVIGAYSTKDKTAYDVFNYIADITQSRWTTRTIGIGKVAIDFYDPSLMPQGTQIEYNNTWFCQNKIIDMTYNYGTWNYRNKQVMTSKEVYGDISQIQTIIYDGYATQIMTELPIGTIQKITVDGVEKSFVSNDEKTMGVYADFYYSIGNNYFERGMTINVGSTIVITYIPIVQGRQIVNNAVEIARISQETGVKGTISRYENRNDATTSLELQKIGQSYIKYKGTPEIKLTVKSENNIWNIGDKVYFNAPINELKTNYMVRSKKTNYIYTANTIFYTYELISSFNSENEINYFDNQRAKANGNIKEGEFVSRNVDIESTANIIFYDTTTAPLSITPNNSLQSELETILGG